MLSLERKPMLPAFGKLAIAGLLVDLPFIALAMIGGNLRIAVSLLAGWGLAVGVYGLLHVIVGRGLDFFTPQKPANGGQRGSMLSIFQFAGAMVGKYLLIGALLFIAWKTGYLAFFPFLGGFVLAQIGITVASVRQMKKPAA